MNYPLQRPIVLESFEVHAVQRQFPIVILLGVSECGNFGDVNVSMLFTVVCGLWRMDPPPAVPRSVCLCSHPVFSNFEIFHFFEKNEKLMFFRELAVGLSEEEE